MLGRFDLNVLCIIGVDEDRVLKDFVRAHVEMLRGPKITVSKWYPDLVHDAKTIRYFYGQSILDKTRALLPHALANRLQTPAAISHQIRKAYRGFFRKHGVDVVLAEFGPTGADITPHLRELDIPLVVHFHGHDAHRSSVVDAYRSRYLEMFAYASAIISVSRKMNEALINLGAPPEKIVLNPYGPRNHFLEVHSDYRPTVLSVGRFTDIKANYLTIAAFAVASENLPDARLVMIGGGELLEACKTLARLWKVESRISFLDSVEHVRVASYFGNARCFAQHSISPSYGDSEGSPVTILEAQAAGLPIVATRHAGIVDTVRENETGFLVDELDVDGMAHQMRRLLLDEDLARQMGAAAKENIVAHFSLTRHIALLQTTLDNAKQRMHKR